MWNNLNECTFCSKLCFPRRYWHYLRKVLEVYELPCKTTVKTLFSTDEGVAFLLRCSEGTIYHAGDLNDWVWNGEPDEENRQAKELIRSDNRNFTQKRSNISRTKATHECK